MLRLFARVILGPRKLPNTYGFLVSHTDIQELSDLEVLLLFVDERFCHPHCTDAKSDESVDSDQTFLTFDIQDPSL